MEIESLKSYLLNKPEAECTFPFMEDVPVYKVKGKMFALLGERTLPDKDLPQTMLNLKCDPDEALALRDIFHDIKAAYHMDKKHWISIYFDPIKGCDVPDGEVQRLIDSSFLLVVNKLTKAQQVSVRLKL